MMSTYGLYRKKPVVVEAMRLDCENNVDQSYYGYDIIPDWRNILNKFPDIVPELVDRRCVAFNIPTIEGVLVALPGDWIIRDLKGEVCVCKPDIFEATYELEVNP
jgi:hypothetical protein